MYPSVKTVSVVLWIRDQGSRQWEVQHTGESERLNRFTHVITDGTVTVIRHLIPYSYSKTFDLYTFFYRSCMQISLWARIDEIITRRIRQKQEKFFKEESNRVFINGKENYRLWG